MRKCRKCNAEYEDTLNYCSKCGALLSSDEPMFEHKDVKVRTFNAWKPLILLLVVIVVLIIGYFVIGSYKDKQLQKRISKEQLEKNKIYAFSTYTFIGEFGEYGADGLALVATYDGSNTCYGFINERFEEVIPCLYTRIEPFEGANTLVQINNKYALMNKMGDLDQLQYKRVSEFSDEGYALVTHQDDTYSFIDRTGKQYGDRYDYAEDPSYEYSWITYETSGRIKKLMIVRENDKYGLINEKISTIVRCKYDEITSYQSDDFHRVGLIKVELNGMCGCIDFRGYEEIPLKYQSLWASDIDGFFVAEYNDMWGLLDQDGDVIVPFKYSSYRDSYDSITFIDADRNRYYYSEQDLRK